MICHKVGNTDVDCCHQANILIDSECCARLADFGFAVIIDESTSGSTTDNRGIGGTARWMAPELLHPEGFGFTDERLKKLPSMSTDIYAIGMTILEVSACLYLQKYQTHLLAGSNRMLPIQRLPQHS